MIKAKPFSLISYVQFPSAMLGSCGCPDVRCWSLITSITRRGYSTTLHIINFIIVTIATSIRTYLKFKIERAVELTTVFSFSFLIQQSSHIKLRSLAIQFARIPLLLTHFSAFPLLTPQPYVDFGLLHQIIPDFSIFNLMDPISQF
jgi:hypothetical protein